MIIEILTGLYFVFFFFTNLSFLKIANKILDKPRFSSKWLYVSSFINSAVFSILVYTHNQLPIITYSMILIGSLIQVVTLFKNNIWGYLMCCFTATIYLICIESITISAATLILGSDLATVIHDHVVLFSLIVISWFLCAVFSVCVDRFVPGRFLRIINQNFEQTLFVLGFLAAATFYMTFNSFIYANAGTMNPVYLPLHQIVAPLGWMIVIALVVTLLIRFDKLHGYKLRSELLEQSIEREKMFNDFMLKKVKLVYEVDCENRSIIRLIEDGKEINASDLPSYDEYVSHAITTKVSDLDRDVVRQVTNIDYLYECYKNSQRINNIHYRRLDEFGEYKWIELSIVVEQKDNRVVALIVLRDIDREKKELIETQNRAERDSLVGAYNKITTQRKITESLRAIPQGAFFILDIDDFKSINDSKGHPFGDKVLIYLHKRIANVFREQDVVGRIGGDEFIIFLKNAPSIQLIKAKAEALCKDITVPFSDEKGDMVSITISIGITMAPQHGKDFETLYANADKALYKSKRDGKNTYTIFGE